MSAVWERRHPAVAHFEPLFDASHLPPELAAVSEPCGELATHMVVSLLGEYGDGDVQEVEAGLRKLLEAKDCFVRAAIAKLTAPDDVDPGER
jgi:hypothetical protein